MPFLMETKTHFLVLQLLTSLSLIGFTAAAVSITCDNGQPPLESSMVFAGLTAVYVLFYNFCNDMNDPFDGVYQIKRSAVASYLLQIKWIVTNQPYGQSIKFDTGNLESILDGYGDVAETISLAELISRETDELEPKALVEKPETLSNHDCNPIPENLTIESLLTLEEQSNEATTTTIKTRAQSDDETRNKLVKNSQSSGGQSEKEIIDDIADASLDSFVPTIPAAHLNKSFKISPSYFRRVGGFQ